jgi:hypothetical protein
MRIDTEQLTQHLTRELKPLYIVFGAEPLLALEAADRIRAKPAATATSNAKSSPLNPGFKWSELAMAANSQSLFAARKLLELRIPTASPAWKARRPCKVLCGAARRHHRADRPAGGRLARAKSRLVRRTRKRRHHGGGDGSAAQGTAAMARRPP